MTGMTGACDWPAVKAISLALGAGTPVPRGADSRSLVVAAGLPADRGRGLTAAAEDRRAAGRFPARRPPPGERPQLVVSNSVISMSVRWSEPAYFAGAACMLGDAYRERRNVTREGVPVTMGPSAPLECPVS
jgi:hypothetical protein